MTLYNDNDKFCCQWIRNLVDAGHLPDGRVECEDIRKLDASTLPETCHFFAGIGGWPLALKLAGWPEAEPVWTASCPCQPFSCAGKRKGYDDERDLWPDFFRLVAECRPQVIFGEQVASADVIGCNADADMFSMWNPEIIVRISEWLEGEEISSLQSLRERNTRTVSENKTEAREGEQKVAGQEQGMATGIVGKRPGKGKGSAVHDYIPGNPGEGRCGRLRGDRNPVQLDGAEGLELPFVGSNQTRRRIHARKYASGDLCLQRDGERVGRATDFGCCSGDHGPEAEELKRLVGQIIGEAEANHRLEWITRIRTDLEGIGYTFGASILPAAGVSAPHIRQRLYWVAKSTSEQVGRTGQSRQLSDGRMANDISTRLEKWKEQPARQERKAVKRSRTLSGMEHTDSAREHARTSSGKQPLRDERYAARFWDAFDIVECKDAFRRVEPGSFPLAHGIPARMGRLRAYGNAIVVPLAVEFVKAVMET